ncbi:MAG: thioredoxin family protein [Myxococcaceae bacterium]
MGFFEKLFGPKAPQVPPVHVDDDNFRDEVLRAKEPVLLDIWSDGCAPCRQLEPIVMRLSTEYQGRVKVAEVNAATAPRAMRKLGVMGTPTVIYFRRGREVERVVGVRGEHYHREVIEARLLAAPEPFVKSEQPG